MHLDERPFMVLTLESAGSGVAGTLVRPRRMTSDGLSFSAISRETVTDRVTGAAPNGNVVGLIAATPDDPSDMTEFEFRLTSPDAAGLKPIGAPFEPWPFTRHPGGETLQVWTGWDASRSYPAVAPYVPPNPEMAAIYKADQAGRQSMESFQSQSARITEEDAKRRQQVRALLATGALRAGEDFRLAALVFQHGSEPDDYLLAHTFALVALAKGDRSAAWIASASLDRYLRSVGKPQIFGTGFSPDGRSQEPFDRTLIPDALRRELGVPPVAEQQEQMQRLLRQMNPGTPAR
jgi:hypothetical protein